MVDPITTRDLKEPETMDPDDKNFKPRKLDVVTTKDIKQRAAPEPGDPKNIENVMITTRDLDEKKKTPAKKKKKK